METNVKAFYNNEYIPGNIRWGRFTNLLGCVLSFGPILVCSLVYGLTPSLSQILSGCLMLAATCCVNWFVEPITYSSSLGIAGTYMAFLSGNIAYLRLPVSVAVLDCMEYEPGSPKADVAATIGIAVSVVVNAVMLTAGVVAGAAILSSIPETVRTALNNLLPALLGAMMARRLAPVPRAGVFSIVFSGVMILLNKKTSLFSFLSGFGGAAGAIIMLMTVLLTILVAKKFDFKKKTE